jgi:hypothetical protein
MLLSMYLLLFISYLFISLSFEISACCLIMFPALFSAFLPCSNPATIDRSGDPLCYPLGVWPIYIFLMVRGSKFHGLLVLASTCPHIKQLEPLARGSERRSEMAPCLNDNIRSGDTASSPKSSTATLHVFTSIN